MSSRFKNINRKIEYKSADGYGCFVITILFFILLIYFVNTNEYFGIIGSVFLIYLSIKFLIKDYTARKKIHLWFKENNGKTIFFYPTNKTQQEKIQNEITGKLKESIAQIYYDGPKLIGDITNKTVVRFILNPLNVESPNLPKFLSITTDGLNLICNLEEFMKDEYDKEILNKLIEEMNSYA